MVAVVAAVCGCGDSSATPAGDEGSTTTGGSEETGAPTGDESGSASTGGGSETGQSVATEGSTGSSSSSSSGGGSTGDATGLDAPELTLELAATKQFAFTWTDVESATFYRLWESVAGDGSFEQLGDDLTETTVSHTMPLHLRASAAYYVEACDAEGCTASAEVEVPGALADAIGYFKASNTDALVTFGYGMALSGDGTTLAVGAPGERSGASEIDGDQQNTDGPGSGAVYVFVLGDDGWEQQAYIKAGNATEYDSFGWSVALSQDGNVLVVGAPNQGLEPAGPPPVPPPPPSSGPGAAYVFSRTGSTWEQDAFLQPAGAEDDDRLGWSVAVSADGTTAAAGAILEGSAAIGLDGDASDNTAASAGAAYVFDLTTDGWVEAAYLKATNSDASDLFGIDLAISSDGDIVVVGAPGEASAGADEDDNSAPSTGAAYVFDRSGSDWETSYLKASNAAAGDGFGARLTISSDGSTLAVAAPDEDSGASDVDGDQSSNSNGSAGAVYVFVHDGAGWDQQAYVKASNPSSQDLFGIGIALSETGDTLAIGAVNEASTAIGVGGDQDSNAAPDAGAVYVLRRDAASAWASTAYVKAPNTDQGDRFGVEVDVSDDGLTLAVGASGESSSATGVNGNQAINTVPGQSGAVYVY